MNENLLIFLDVSLWCQLLGCLLLPPPALRSLHLHVNPSSPSAHPIIKSFSCCLPKCHVTLELSHIPSHPLYFQCQDLRKRVPVFPVLLFTLSRNSPCRAACIGSDSVAFSYFSLHTQAGYFWVTAQKWMWQTPFFFTTDMWHLSVSGLLLSLWWNLQLSVHDYTGTAELQISPVL